VKGRKKLPTELTARTVTIIMLKRKRDAATYNQQIHQLLQSTVNSSCGVCDVIIGYMAHVWGEWTSSVDVDVKSWLVAQQRVAVPNPDLFDMGISNDLIYVARLMYYIDNIYVELHVFQLSTGQPMQSAAVKWRILTPDPHCIKIKVDHDKIYLGEMNAIFALNCHVVVCGRDDLQLLFEGTLDITQPGWQATDTQGCPLSIVNFVRPISDWSSLTVPCDCRGTCNMCRSGVQQQCRAQDGCVDFEDQRFYITSPYYPTYAAGWVVVKDRDSKVKLLHHAHPDKNAWKPVKLVCTQGRDGIARLFVCDISVQQTLRVHTFE